MMWNGYDGWSMHDGGGWILMLLTFVLVASAVAAVVVALGRSQSTTRAGDARPDEPYAEADRILQRRLAAGEIGEDEFLRRRSLLHHGT